MARYCSVRRMAGSLTRVTLLCNITFYSSCGPNFESQYSSKSRYENFDEIELKYIYILYLHYFILSKVECCGSRNEVTFEPRR